MNRLLLLASAASLCTAARGAPVEWRMDDVGEVVNATNIADLRVEGGRLCGQSLWDPHFSLNVPDAGIDASELSWLETRIYSSAPADLLDIYYLSPDGHWCLGGRLPIARGWATYRVDLKTNAWRETLTGDVSRQWGGPSKRVAIFRLDPGNEAGRWLMVDFVRLLPKPEDAQEGVAVEEPWPTRLLRLEAPAATTAGRTISVTMELEAEPPPEPAQATLYLRLRRDSTVLWLHEQTLPVTEHLRVAARIPLSRYWNAGAYVLEGGSYELDLGQPATRAIQVTNPRGSMKLSGRMSPSV